MTREAELLHVTQPTLPKALKVLEDELGRKLFTRHSFSIALTDEGALLRDRAEDLVTMADRIEEEFLHVCAGGAGLSAVLSAPGGRIAGKRPGVSPAGSRLEAKLYLIWNRYQTFTPIADRFLAQVKNSFPPGDQGR